MNAYIKALRLPFLAGSLTPVIIGSAFALYDKCFSFMMFLLCLIGMAGLHLGANLANDYFDASGSDPINLRLTPFSGGSRVIQDSEVSPRLILLMALFLFAVGAGVGIWLIFLGRPVVIILGFIGLGAGWSYSAPPLQFMSRGWGELLIFFAFGPLVTLGTYYVMSDSLNWTAFALGLPHGFFITGVIWINQFPDYEADLEAGKKNLVVRLGPSISRYLFFAIMLSAFISVIFLISSVGLSYLLMLSFVALPLAIKAMKILWKEYSSHRGVIPAQALTIQSLLVHGMLLSVGLILSRFVGN